MDLFDTLVEDIKALQPELDAVVDSYKKINKAIAELEKNGNELVSATNVGVSIMMNDFMERLNGEALEPFDIEEN